MNTNTSTTTRVKQTVKRILGPTISKKLRRQPHWFLAAVVIVMGAVYWAFWASGRYVSEAHVVIDSPQINMQTMNISSLISGAAGAGDLLLLRDHMLSVDMLEKLQQKLDLRSHYSQSSIDMFSRLGDAEAPIEKFHAYMLGRITIEFDDYAGVLRVRAQAYTPEMAQAITETLLQEGEAHMNNMGQRLALEQVKFIEKQAQTLEQRLFAARDEIIAFQNEHGLVSPTGTVEAIFTTVSELEAQLAVLKARERAMKSYQSASSPERVRLSAEIKSLEEQAEAERAKLASLKGDTLNKLSAQYETLELRAQFALDVYSQSLMALETTRVEAARTLKQISVLQYPSMPQYQTQPRRLYNITVLIVFTVFLAAIAHLTRSIIRDHRS